MTKFYSVLVFFWSLFVINGYGQSPALQTIPACGNTSATYSGLVFTSVACYTGTGETVAVNLTGTQQLVIKSGANIAISSFVNTSGNKLFIEPGANVTISSSITLNGSIVNYGTLTLSGGSPTLTLASTAKLYNENTMAIATNIQFNSSTYTVVNGGSLSIGTGSSAFSNFQLNFPGTVPTSSVFTLRAGSILNILSSNGNGIFYNIYNSSGIVFPTAGLFQYSSTDISGNNCINPARINYYAGSGRPFICSAGCFPVSGNISNNTNIVWVGNTPVSSNTGSSSLITSGFTASNPAAFILTSKQQAPAPSVPYSYIKYCNGATPATLTATGLSTASTLTWYTAANGTAGKTSVAPTPAVGFSGIYYVSQTVNSCEGPRTPIVIAQSTSNGSVISVSNNSPCTGSALTLTGPAGYSAYKWTGPNNYTSSVQSPTVSVSATTAMSGIYALVITNGTGASACNLSVNTTVTVSSGSPASAPTATIGSNASCSQITANWNSVAGATAYLLDVSTTNTFGSFVTGYNALNVGNVTTYTITGLTSGTTFYYRVRARNACGINATNSNTISYSTTASPSITTQPTNKSVCAGSPVTFTVTASGSGLSYQWRKNGTNINGATSVNYTINSTVTADAGNYDVIVSGICAPSATSSAASLTVYSNSVPTTAPSGSVSTCNGCNLTITASTGSSYLWSNGATTRTISVNQPGSYYVTVTNSNGCSNTSATVTVSMTQCNFIWNGSVSNEWSDPLNWAQCTPPNSSHNVTIPSGTSNSPVISGIASCRDLTIQSGANLTQNSNSTLSIYGNLLNTGTFTSNGTIMCNGGTSQSISGVSSLTNLAVSNPSGVTLIDKLTINGILTLTSGPLNSNGNLTVNLNTGTIAGTGTGSITGNITVFKYAPKNMYHEIGNPLTGSSIPFTQWADDSYIAPGFLYSYDETIISANYMDGWVGVTNLNSIIGNMKGYALYYHYTSGTIGVTGTYDHLTNPSVAISNTISSNPDADGWNLLANPYPSTIDWDASGWTKTNIDNSIYVWDGINQKYMSYVNGSSSNEGSRYVTSMQAFWVYCNNPGGTGNVGISNTVRVTNINPPLYKTEETTQSILRLKAINGKYSDETVIRLTEGPTENFDGNWDAYKLNNGGNTPNFYSRLNNVSYSINSLPNSIDNLILPLLFEPKFDGFYTIDISGIESFDPTMNIVLIDSLLNKSIEITQALSYSFDALTSDSKNRFYLSFKTTSSGPATPILGNKPAGNIEVISCGSDGKEINIQLSNINTGKASLELYTLYSQKINQLDNIEIIDGMIRASMSVPTTGIYLVKLTIEGKSYTGRVFLVQ